MNQVTVEQGSREHRVANHTLTYVGENTYSDLGIEGLMDLYQRRLRMFWSETLKRYVTIPEN